MKKILAIALALVMIMSLAVFATAAETTLPDVVISNWWGAHSQGVEVTEEGVSLSFLVTADADATENYHTASVVVHAGAADALGAEYWVQRADAWGWLYGENIGDHAAALNEKGYSWEFLFAEGFDWANFRAAMLAGAEATVDAKLEGSNMQLTYIIAGVTSKVTIPVDTSKPVFICMTGEKVTISNIVVTTPDAPVEAPFAAGDQVKIYYPDGDTFITANANDNGKKLLGGTEAEAAAWTVEVNENGYFSFVVDGKYMTSGETGNQLYLAEANSELAQWELLAAENGFYLRNVGANYNGNYNQYLEFYSGFTTYGFNETKANIYTFQFVKVEAEEEPAPEEKLTAVLKFADSDYWPFAVDICPTEITGSGTYTFTLDNITATYGAPLDMAYMLYIEVEGGYEALKDMVISDVKVIVDGEEIAVNQDFVWTYESLGTDYLPNGNYCIEIYNALGYSGAGYGAAIDPNIFADESVVISFTMTDPNAPVDPNPNQPTGDIISVVLAFFAISGMGLTAVASKKR